MKQKWKKRAVAATVLVFVGAAVYLNWKYTDNVADTSKVLGQSTLVNSQEETQESVQETPQSDYFATARLSRKQARDNAISMLQEAESVADADQSVLNEASEALQVLASYTVAEAQIESLVTAKGYADCVAFMGDESVSIVVSTESGELTAADVAKIMDIAMSETDLEASGIKIMAAKNAALE